jgi:hypothetical protein
VKVELSGRRFGKLTVLKEVGRAKNRSVTWRCQCDCGKKIITTSGYLLRGETKSCGCLKRDVLCKRSTTHGQSKTREYKVWAGMINRCKNPSHIGFANYGGRGISVCERWKKFENFLFDMGEPPSPRHTIERKLNSGNYEPENCEWRTRNDQARNTRQNRLLTFRGKTQCLTDWAREIGMPIGTLFYRLNKGFSVPDALMMPLQPGKHFKI